MFWFQLNKTFFIWKVLSYEMFGLENLEQTFFHGPDLTKTIIKHTRPNWGRLVPDLISINFLLKAILQIMHWKRISIESRKYYIVRIERNIFLIQC